MSEPHLRHQVVRLEGALEIEQVDTDGAAHQHVLGAFDDLAFDLEQVRALEGLEPEEVVVEVAGVVESGVDLVAVLLEHIVDLCGQQGCWVIALILVGVQAIGHLSDVIMRHLVECGDGDTVGKDTEIRVHNGQVGTGLGSQVNNLRNFDA